MTPWDAAEIPHFLPRKQKGAPTCGTPFSQVPYDKRLKNLNIFGAKVWCRSDRRFCSLAKTDGDGCSGSPCVATASFERVR
jgi:hypothetical protein